MFKNDATNKGQAMSYCGFGHHSQNGIAENRIKTLSQDSRAMLAHGVDFMARGDHQSTMAVCTQSDMPIPKQV